MFNILINESFSNGDPEKKIAINYIFISVIATRNRMFNLVCHNFTSPKKAFLSFVTKCKVKRKKYFPLQKKIVIYLHKF